MHTTDIGDLIERAVKEIRDAMANGQPGDGFPETQEDAWKVIEGRIADAISPVIQDAHARGKKEGIDEVKAGKWN